MDSYDYYCRPGCDEPSDCTGDAGNCNFTTHQCDSGIECDEDGDCGVGTCNLEADPPVCVFQGTGDACSDPIIPRFDANGTARISGNNFGADFTSTWTNGTGCEGFYSEEAPELFIRLDLNAEETVNVTGSGDLRLAISLIDGCDSTRCFDSIDSYGNDDLTYIATQNQTIYLVVESYYSDDWRINAAYEIVIRKVHTGCGNGFREDGEQCDDGNLISGDGCESDCQITDGWVCNDKQPSACHTKPAGDSCDQALVPEFDANGIATISGDDFGLDFTSTWTNGDNCANDSSTSEYAPEVFIRLELNAGDIVNVAEKGSIYASISYINGCDATACAASTDTQTYNGLTYTAPQNETIYAVVESRYYYDSYVHDAYEIVITKHHLTCGDGIIDNPEKCDDGNTESGDGCEADCQVTDGWVCNDEQPSACHPKPAGDSCSDAIVPIFENKTARISGDDFEVDFTSQWTQGADCAGSSYYSENAPEVFIKLDLEAGDIVNVTETGPIDKLVISFIGGCLETACAASKISSNNTPQGPTYTAPVDETIYAVVESYYPSSYDYAHEAYEIVITKGYLGCGGGFIEEGEQCDDGNSISGDGCEDDCQVTPGWVCNDEQPSVCHRITCGDGIIEGDETCDTGPDPANASPGCVQCQLTAGWYCGTEQPSVCEQRPVGDTCALPIIPEFDANGRFTLSGTAEGHYFDEDFISTWTQGTDCQGSSYSKDAPEVFFELELEAGDVVNVAETGGIDMVISYLRGCGETACVDSSDLRNDESQGLTYTAHEPETIYAVVESYSSKSYYNTHEAYEIVITRHQLTCGDGIIEGHEECDDGDTDPDNGCDADCQISSGWVCNDAQPSVCHRTSCGDGIIEGDETCDTGPDPANASPGCVQCQITTGWYCGTEQPSVCEQRPVGDTCAQPIIPEFDERGRFTLSGTAEGHYFDQDFISTWTQGTGCKGSSYYSEDAPEVFIELDLQAGDIVNVAETGGIDMVISYVRGCGETACAASDDMNSDESKGLTYIAEMDETIYAVVESYFSDTTKTHEAYEIVIHKGHTGCGGGYHEEGEQCDDGNTESGDGCDENCQEEPGWACNNEEPSICHRITCGDGILEGDEACDDHNTVSGDGCSSTCQEEIGFSCADGFCYRTELETENINESACEFTHGAILTNSFRLSGENFFNDFTHQWSKGSNCEGYNSSDDPEVIFEVPVQAGDLIHVSEHGDIDCAISILEQSCTSACQQSIDRPENPGLIYRAPEDVETIFIVIGNYQRNTSINTAYDIRITRTPLPCENGECPDCAEDRDCMQMGQCIEGLCQCNAGYIGDNCEQCDGNAGYTRSSSDGTCTQNSWGY